MTIGSSQPAPPMPWNPATGQEWERSLWEHCCQAQQAAPLPAGSELTAEQEEQRQIIGGAILAWLGGQLPMVQTQRDIIFRDTNAPVIITSEGAGLLAASQVLAKSPPGHYYLSHRGFSDFCGEHPEMADAKFIHHWSYLSKPRPKERQSLQKAFPDEDPRQLRIHDEGERWGPLQGSFRQYVWAWDGTRMRLVTEAFMVGQF